MPRPDGDPLQDPLQVSLVDAALLAEVTLLVDVMANAHEAASLTQEEIDRLLGL